MPLSSCPSERDLHAFQLGDLPEPVLNQVADHLESCPRCETIARQLDTAVDAILAGVRGAPVVAQTAAFSPAASSPSLLPDAAYPFLRPPVEADEIGRLGNYRVLRLLGKGGM